MDIKKFILSRILPLGALAFMIVSAVAYQNGVYDITFITRPEAVSAETSPGMPLTPPETDLPVIEPPEIEPPHTYEDSIISFKKRLYYTEELIAKGYTVSDCEFDSTYMLGIITPAVKIPTELSLRTRTSKESVRVPDDTYNTYTTEMREIIETVPALEVYMDYILVDNGVSVDVLNSDGTLLYAGLDTSVYVPAYTRDKNDAPLFMAEEPSKFYPKLTVTNYYYIDSDGNLKKSNYNDENDSRGLYVNYPANYGKTDTTLYRYYNKTDELYGYGNLNGHMRTEYKYIHAFNHSEKLACAVESDGLMYFLNENLISKISGSVQIYKNYNSARRRLLREFVMPDTFGEESLGFFYFDHGLVRVRCQIVDAYHWIERHKRYTASDEDILIRKDGTEFPLPSDYQLISYSNGVILLEKDGAFGYMDYTGKWILEPIYTEAKPFYEGLAVVGDGNKVGMINTSGEFVIPMLFEYIENASGGVVAAFSNDHGWTLLNKLAAPQR